MNRFFLCFILLALSFTAPQEDSLKRANDSFDRGEYLNSIRFYMAYELSAGAHLMNGKIELAQECYELSLLSNSFLSAQEYEKAKNLFLQILEINPKDPHAQIGYEACVHESNLIFEQIFRSMVPVVGGSFLMGSIDSIARSNEMPVHLVTVNSFRIANCPVTQRAWREVMGSCPSRLHSNLLPVEMVSWDDVVQFIQKLNDITGLEYRLPTEAEWEFAARGGNNSQNYTYSGSNQMEEAGWCNQNSYTIPHWVGEKRANELGLYDMSGNVWEWCVDWYSDYTEEDQIDPCGPESGTRRIVRGGSWYDIEHLCRVSYRRSFDPDTRSEYIGFRLCLSGLS